MLKAIKNETEAKMLLELFGGEFEDKDGNEFVIIGVPDNSGILYENIKTNEEGFKKYHGIFISEKKYNKLIDKIEEYKSMGY